MKTPILIGAVASLAFTSCAIKDPPGGADILTESARDKIPGHWSGSHRGGEIVPAWIHTFNDPELTRLVEDAVNRNPDLAAAAARVEASRAAVRVAASTLYPRIALKGLAERQGREITSARGGSIDPPDLGGLGVEQSGGAGDTSNLLDRSTQRWVYGLGIGGTWEADVWGRIRSKKAAAKAESAALEADYEFARQSLAASVARAYFSTIEAAQQAANAAETMSFYKEALQLADKRKEVGQASDFDLAQIKARAAGALDTLYAAQASRAQAIRAIEVVTSHYPSGDLLTRRSFPSQPRPVPSGLPSQLLERRPDVIAAERRFAASFHRVNEARTARLPRFAISASGGMGTAQLDTVGVIEAVTWSLAAGVVQPIFFGGELKGAQDIRTAEQKAAAASYTASALRAFADVEDALSNEVFLAKRESALDGAVEHTGIAVKLGQAQLEAGHADTFTILRLSGENLAAKIELTKIRASRLRERVNLHLALGGDFKGTGMPGK